MNGMDQKSLIHTCYELSIAQLHNNTSEYGLSAAGIDSHSSKSKNYASLFPRDIGVCSIGILMSGNKHLIEVLRKSLAELAETQSERGQFPFYYTPEEKQVRWWNPGSIDSTLWWCIAYLLYVKHTKDKDFQKIYASHLEKAFTWLQYQDTNNDLLLEQGEASDWADKMPRHGTVLYSNALWYWLISLRAEVEKQQEFSELKKKVYEAFNTLFWVHKHKSNATNYIPDNGYTRENAFANELIETINNTVVDLPYYIGFVAHKTFEARCDVFGNMLAIMTGLADGEKTNRIVDFVKRSAINKPYPMKVLYPTIYPGEADFREYMIRSGQNFPWQYHNGGIWPFVGSFWVMVLSTIDLDLAEHELERVAYANSLNDFEFNEYLHGEYGTPMGVPYQSWNMAMFIAAYHAVLERKSVGAVRVISNQGEKL